MKCANKFVALALCAALALSMAGCQAESVPAQGGGASFAAGTYEGEAQGMEGVIRVAVTLGEDKIEKVEVLESSETETIGEVALDSLPGAVVAAQSTQIDGVASATITSDAFFAAVNAALAAAGVDPASLAPQAAGPSEAGEAETLECDVVIVGAGGAGMTAALRADQAGLDVLVLEKQAFVGGATAMSGGNSIARGSKYQAEQGIEDTAEDFFLYLMQNGDYQNDGTPAWLLARYSGEAVDWLDDEMGVGFEDAISGTRVRFSDSRNGAGMVQNFYEVLQGRDIPVMLNTRAYELTSTDGTVDGVKARDVNTGKEYVVKTKAVLLATGGYCCDPDYIGEQNAGLVLSGSKANTGDGIDMALPYGAVLQNMDCVNVASSGIVKNGMGQHTKRANDIIFVKNGAVIVNQDGERFANENGPGADFVQAQLQQERAFVLMDAETFQVYADTCVSNKYFTQEQLDQWLEENGTGETVFAHGDTLAEAAEKAGVDAAGLQATVERYNGFVEAGEDADFGHAVSAAIGDGPYYLVERVVAYSTTLGGLTINDRLQLVDELNQPIPGLYAAGELVGGVDGAHFPGSCGVGWALTSGYLAGGEIAQALGK